MIKSHDRRGWIGASDTSYVMGNWKTKSFSRWWLTKLGAIWNTYQTKEMMAGTAYEHAILKHLGIKRTDRQIKIRSLRLRVNLDGEIFTTIKEVKTHYSEKPTVTIAYWRQAQVEMFATGKNLEIVFYRMTDEEYKNYFLPIDGSRLTVIAIEYDLDWIINEYLPRLKYLAWCLKKRKTPDISEFEGMQNAC